MTDTVMTGDLCRDWYDRDVRVAEQDCRCCDLIAKGPGWVRHDGSSVNPVPGAEVSAFGPGLDPRPATSDCFEWSGVQFYRVTGPVKIPDPAPSQPPAPQPGWVATVTLEWAPQSAGDRSACVCIKWPNGNSEAVYRASVIDLPWSPPPPPPWEPEIGKEATYQGNDVTVLFIGREMAMVEDRYRNEYEATLSDLSPPKGGA
jgi:hypothetical protein